MTADKTTVLVVEDSETLRRMVSMTLEERGYHVVGAADGVTALELLGQRTPDVILLDINLPDIDGFEVCKRIKAEPWSHNIPVIVMTGLGESGFEIMAIEAGADDFITKPIDPLVLDARIQMILRRMTRERFDNPLTGLPGSVPAEEHLAHAVSRDEPFAALFVDIDDFAAFNACYGYNRGDLLIGHAGQVIMETLRFHEAEDAFVGHIGGDDFVIVCEPASANTLAEEIVKSFGADSANYFEDEDRERGYFIVADRRGNESQHEPLTLSVAIVSTADREFDSTLALRAVGQELLRYAKGEGGGRVVVDRRKGA